MEEETPVVTDAPVVESEPQIEQTDPVETSEVATLEQPTSEPEEKKSRSQERIHQLTRERDEAKETAEYWQNINKQPEVLPVEESDDGFTLDQIASSVINKQAEIQAKVDRERAAEMMKKDVADTIKAYPELESDDDLAAIVVSFAERQKISIKSAADKFFGIVSKEKETAEKKTIATQAQRSGVSSPQGAPVGNGDMPVPDISSMSDEQKASAWGSILSGYSK